MSRTKEIGDWGESITPNLLARAGFSEIQDLNQFRYNHPFADFLAKRGGSSFLIGVRTRNKFTKKGPLNSPYNVRKKGYDLSSLSVQYKAELAWVAIQLIAEEQKFSAFFGTVEQIEEKGERFSIPMTRDKTATYECLARDQFDPAINPAWTNQCLDSKSR